MDNIPFDKITSFGQQTMLDKKLFNVSWILGRFCNYKCSYCWPYARTDSPDYIEFDTYIKTIDEIKRQARLNGFTSFHWSFSGGEPTAYKQLLDLIKYLDELESPYQSVHMTTNLSPSIAWWKRFHEHTSLLQRRSITASYHNEFAKETEFGDKCVSLMDDNIFVTINQVMVPSLFYELYERCERFKSRGINVTLKPQSNEQANAIVEGYTDDMINIMRNAFEQEAKGTVVQQIRLSDSINTYYMDQAERFNSYGFNQFTNWTCNSGYQSVIIRGVEVKRGYSCRDDILGTLTNGFNLFKEPTICTTNRCVSSADSKIPKCKN